MLKKLLTLAFVLSLSACSSRGIVSIPGLSDEPEVNFDNLYLLGVFNWWEANPAYKLNEGSAGWYVDVELIADGQPYDFRFSDDVWTPSQSCGGKYKGELTSVSTPIYLICGSDSENLQFTPNTTGTYRFSVVNASGHELRLVITRQQ